MTLINTRIITHPLNWAIIIMMLVIAGMAGHLLASYFDQEPTHKNDSNLPQGLTAEQYAPDNTGALMASMSS